MIWNVPNIWEGGRCFIIGGGTSIVEQFNIPHTVVNKVRKRKAPLSVYSPFMESIHNEHVIGINVAYKIGNWIDALVFGDSSFWKKYEKEILQFPNLKITQSNRAANHPDIKVVRRCKQSRNGITTDRKKIRWGVNSGAMAINIAYHFGVKEIILLGYDMYINEGQRHYHNVYNKVREDRAIKTMRNHLKCFPFIAADAKKLGLKIYNANPKSNIQAFEKVNLKDVL